MTEIVMLVWLGDVARSVSFMLALLLVVGLATGACIAVVAAGDGYEPSRGLVSSTALSIAILALVLSVMPSRDTIHLYAAARAALLRAVREVAPAK